jgi:hypothetical protein
MLQIQPMFEAFKGLFNTPALVVKIAETSSGC